MLIRFILALALALSLSACGLPPRIALEPGVKDKLDAVQVDNIVGQDEIIVRAEAYGASAALGGGLIGAIIDSKVGESRQATIQDSMKPFYSAVDDYDFRTELNTALTTALQQGTPFAQVAVTTAYLAQPPQVEQRRVALGERRGLLEVYTLYSFSPDFSKLTLTSRAAMQLAGTEKPAYLNTFYYESAPVAAAGTAPLQAWAADNGQAFRAAAREAIAELVAMLKLDLNAAATDPAGAKAGAADVTLPVKMQVKGPVLASTPGRTVLRAGNGNLYSVHQP